MLKLSSPSIIKPLSIIFPNCLQSAIFPDDWKKGNIVPIHKKTVNSIYSFMIHNKLLNSFQSGFRPNDSCINQLISITHNIYRAFDANPSLEVRGVFLDLSKAFDKI